MSESKQIQKKKLETKKKVSPDFNNLLGELLIRERQQNESKKQVSSESRPRGMLFDKRKLEFWYDWGITKEIERTIPKDSDDTFYKAGRKIKYENDVPLYGTRYILK